MTFYHPLKAGTFTESSPFGPRWGTLHRGTDYAAKIGTPIYAPADGVIVQGKDRTPGSVAGFGSWIWLDAQAACGKDFIFGHVAHAQIVVSRGDRVKAGQLIGHVGNEGESTGPHLHFEAWTSPGRSSGQAIDPAAWLQRARAQNPSSISAPSPPVKVWSPAGVPVWHPDTVLLSPNTSGDRDIRKVLWVIFHTDESAYDYAAKQVRATGWTAKRLAEYQQSKSAGGSYSAAADRDGKTARIAQDGKITWSTGNIGNVLGYSICFAGTTAYFTRAQWLERMTQLRAGAAIAAPILAANGIPPKRVAPGDMKTRRKGIAGHDNARELGSTTHWDPGPGFPWDVMEQLLKERLNAMNPDQIRALVREEVENFFNAQVHNSLVPGSERKMSLTELIRLIDLHVHENRKDVAKLTKVTTKEIK